MKYITIFIVALFFSGCSFSTYYKTELDPSSNFNKQKSIIVFSSENPTIEDKKIKLALIEELKKQGYTTKDNLPADYGLFFYINDQSYTETNSFTTYAPQTTYGSAYVNGKYVYGQTTTNTPVSNTYTSTRTYKKINYYLVNSIPGLDGKRNTEWSGFTSTDADYFAKNPNGVVEKLVSLIGKEFKGEIYIEDKSSN